MAALHPATTTSADFMVEDGFISSSGDSYSRGSSYGILANICRLNFYHNRKRPFAAATRSIDSLLSLILRPQE